MKEILHRNEIDKKKKVYNEPESGADSKAIDDAASSSRKTFWDGLIEGITTTPNNTNAGELLYKKYVVGDDREDVRIDWFLNQIFSIHHPLNISSLTITLLTPLTITSHIQIQSKINKSPKFCHIPCERVHDDTISVEAKHSKESRDTQAFTRDSFYFLNQINFYSFLPFLLAYFFHYLFHYISLLVLFLIILMDFFLSNACSKEKIIR